MLLALLEKKMGFAFGKYDVFVNITGGIKITEPSADLAIVASIISSLKNRPLSRNSIFIGEVSLTGDVRNVHSMDIRVKEALNQGFDKVVLREKLSIKKIKYFQVDRVEKIIDWM
jgi:DNA repair protein RadA/Sms